MPNAEKLTNDNFKNESVEYRREEVEVMNSNSERYSGVYKEMAELLGDAAAIKIWKRCSGLNITFPQKLYSREYTKQYIMENMEVLTPQEMAKNMSLSERRVRQIITEIKAGNLQNK